ncbi:AtpA: V-type proton ATPase catalytic subunit A [Desulfosarcina variabilis str. Montpellier]|uniref:V-type ATP synthase subunit A n=1 Tax=Desulfosarcina variabilis TaxID=2300 RepID=UPI003AFA3B07
MERNQHPPKAAVITAINGPVIKVKHAAAFSMNEMVLIGPEHLLGEVVRLVQDQATIQVYDDTTGLKPGLPVHGQGLPLYVELGPGLVGRIFDGTQRPLSGISQPTDVSVHRGRARAALERHKAWSFTPLAAAGSTVEPGQVIGEVMETSATIHRILIPPNCSGRIIEIVPQGSYAIEERIALVEDAQGTAHKIKLFHPWPVRQNRPYGQRMPAGEPLFTGLRVIDFFFPLAKGGTAAIPGGFGTGKTITQHQLSKWADADIIVYIGCGERGNEMAGVLEDFPRLLDPRSGRPLIERTVLIANTSDMPVAAREASIYTGITIAEYYRDMGHHVALMADSTSRWAEALREISGRLEEMPAEEGFPAYLASRLAEFYERAGAVRTLGGATGSVSVIGAVSPPGGDFSEPVTQQTRRFVSTFWALDKEFASARYFPAINYLTSYSAYVPFVATWWQAKAGLDWLDMRDQCMAILKEEARLQNIVKLIGEDALPEDQKATYYGAALIKEDFLQQSAYDPIDTHCPAEKQVLMLQIILDFISRMRQAVTYRIPIYRIMALPVVEELHRMKTAYKGDDPLPFEAIGKRLDEQFEGLLKKEL